jgi:hypothetical protein
MIFHALVINPQAGEETRGYLHGGLFIDFIGQKPVSVLRLLSFDVLIFLIDFIMLALIIERVKMVGPTTPPTTTTDQTTTNTNSNPAQPTAQDQDAEERGMMRGPDDTETGDPESNTATPPPITEIDDDVNDERTTLLAEPGESDASYTRDGHPLDTFSAGQAVIVDMGFLGTIRDQWKHSVTTQRPSSGFVPSPETATFLRQRFGLQVGTDGRIARVDR